MKRSRRLLAVLVLVVVLFAVMLGFSTPAGAWLMRSPANGWGTHDWILDPQTTWRAVGEHGHRPPRERRPGSRVAIDWLNHSYDVWGTVKKDLRRRYAPITTSRSAT